jgi:hypothetical protein
MITGNVKKGLGLLRSRWVELSAPRIEFVVRALAPVDYYIAILNEM